MRKTTCTLLFFLVAIPAFLIAGEPQKLQPDLITPRSWERTGFQEASPRGPRYDLRTDFVMAYGTGPHMKKRLQEWKKAGYVLQVMTGIAWGNYQDYLNGKFDGRRHTDEGQVDAAGNPIDHGPTVPYMVPAVSFSDYLEEGLKKVIGAGAVAIHLEEPEFWARAGFSNAFQREWRIFYNEPWTRPDESCDAQYRASKLKYYLYQRALDRVCSSMKEYAATRHGRLIRFYVPTHSLLNYTQWCIVSPQSSLIDLPGVDGYIAQVWTGTSRTPNVYQGRTAERTFETAFLEYGIMQELVRGTGRRMWFLNDPVEDNPRHDWNDYRTNYIRTLIAALLQPDVWHYEVAPWPRRVFEGRFPSGNPNARKIPEAYASMLAVVFNQLRDMKQNNVDWQKATEGVGVFLADSAMFQRAEPAFSKGIGKESPLHATQREARMFTGFYGLALPPLKRGIPIQPVQLDNIARFPGYLDRYKVLLLSYEFLKPLSPGIHLALAQWVKNGGALIYAGGDTDPFHQVREWWNSTENKYNAPSEHLFEALGLSRKPETGSYKSGKGLVMVDRVHPAFYSRSKKNAERLMKLLHRGVDAAGGTYREKNSFVLRRGPYVIAACMSESTGRESLELEGTFVDLLDARLSVRKNVTVPPGSQAWLLDLGKVKGAPPLLLAAGGRIETWSPSGGGVDYTITTPADVVCHTRILLSKKPKEIKVKTKAVGSTWDAATKTVTFHHAGDPEGVSVSITW